MTKDECYRLGNITKPFGYKGQMVFYLDVDSPQDYADLDSVFIETKTGLVPYFFKVDNINGNKAVVTFEDLTPDEAHALAGHDLYLPLDLLPKLTGNQFYFHEVIGFRVVDSQHGDIGTLQSIIEYPATPFPNRQRGQRDTHSHHRPSNKTGRQREQDPPHRRSQRPDRALFE